MNSVYIGSKCNILEKFKKEIKFLEANDKIIKEIYIKKIVLFHVNLLKSKKIYVEKNKENNALRNALTEIKKEMSLEKDISLEYSLKLLNIFKIYYLYKYNNENFFNLKKFYPPLIDMEFYEILVWIFCVKIKGKQSYSFLFLCIKEFQYKPYEADIKKNLQWIFFLIAKRIARG